MGTGEIIAIVSSVTALLLGIIAFFLKRTINQVDRLEEKKACKTEVDDLKKEVQGLERNISEIKSNYLTKDDFYREQAKTDRKLDGITDILMKIMRHIGGGDKDE